MHDVFISYSRKDQEKAEKIRGILEQNGITCWYAPDDIHGNRKFTKEIPQAIRGSKAFLLLLSENSQASKWVERELGEADAGNIPIYTLFLEECKLNDQFNFVLRFNQHYGFELGFEEQMRRLVKEFKEELAAPFGAEPPAEIKASAKKRPHVRKFVWVIAAVVLVMSAVLAAVMLWPKGEESKDGKYVIWNPAYSVALSRKDADNANYRAGEQVLVNGNKTVDHSESCVWQITFIKDDLITIGADGTNLGVEPGYNGVGLGGDFSADQWKLIETDEDMYYIRNVESGKYLEWYNDKKNWATHDKVTDQNRDMFLIRLQKVS